MKALIVSSATSDKVDMPAGVVYLATIFDILSIPFDILDLSGSIDYFDPPEELLTNNSVKDWLSPYVSWIDKYLPEQCAEVDLICYSALFSPDIIVYARHFAKQKKENPKCIGIIGGTALNNLNKKQRRTISRMFNIELSGYRFDNILPNYSRVKIKPFVTVYGGEGCTWGKCRFCNSNGNYKPVLTNKLLANFRQLQALNGIFDVMVSSDCFSKEKLEILASSLIQENIKVPYNIMLRGEKWVSKELGRLLSESGCTDIFIGVEALHNDILRIINKGIDAQTLSKAVINLSGFVKVQIGLILFIPGVKEKWLNEQLCFLEKILSYVDTIDLEILSVVQGSEFAKNPKKYGIKLNPSGPSINDSWCYGLSPDIPWVFSNKAEIDIWFKYIDKLYNLIKDFVEPCYWENIDAVKARF